MMEKVTNQSNRSKGGMSNARHKQFSTHILEL